MPISRRRMLRVIGGGTVLAAGTGAGVFLTTRRPDKALAPWDAAGGYSEPRRRALSYALLAPNPHNRQPWLVDLRELDMVHIYRDKAKNLPATDPFDRQLTIGMGCFVELMVIAAAQTGHDVELNLFPAGEDGPVASGRFVANAARPDPLFAAVRNRRSCKEAFDLRPITPQDAIAITPYGRVINDPRLVSDLVDLTSAAWKVEAKTPRTLKESVDLMRIGKAEINANPDGIHLGGPFLSSLSAMGMLSGVGQMDQSSAEYAQGVAMYDEMIRATPAYVILTSEENSRLDQITIGRKWMRLNLAATGMGIALHPVSQALQEYPEMRVHRERLHRLLAANEQTVQMLGRLGYGPTTQPSPRWPLEAKLINV